VSRQPKAVGDIALFEFEQVDEGVRIASERHYGLSGDSHVLLSVDLTRHAP